MLPTSIEQTFEQDTRCGVALLLLRNRRRAISRGRGLFTVPMCTSRRATRRADPAELLARYDPGFRGARLRAAGIG